MRNTQAGLVRRHTERYGVVGKLTLCAVVCGNRTVRRWCCGLRRQSSWHRERLTDSV